MPSQKVYVKWEQVAIKIDGSNTRDLQWKALDWADFKIRTPSINQSEIGENSYDVIFQDLRVVFFYHQFFTIRDNATATGQSTAKILAVSNLHDDEEMERWENRMINENVFDDENLNEKQTTEEQIDDHINHMEGPLPAKTTYFENWTTSVDDYVLHSLKPMQSSFR
uniref:Uncharacterized protein n=1 Tax=Romanomermis culicivorax TaxID=13658 RepID=A0A915K0Z9_ROMCU